MCIKCDCEKCLKVKFNLKNDLWYHLTKINLPLGQRGNLYDLFPNDKEKNILIKDKPKNVLWCSAGTWLYDPYHDMEHMNTKSTISKILLITKISSDVNILRITNVKELIDFRKQYGKKWDIVKSKYDAMSIEFCKFICLDSIDDKTYDLCEWQLSYDVESLMIFNKKAFNYDVVYLEI